MKQSDAEAGMDNNLPQNKFINQLQLKRNPIVLQNNSKGITVRQNNHYHGYNEHKWDYKIRKNNLEKLIKRTIDSEPLIKTAEDKALKK